MKTVAHWYRELPEPIRSRAIKNTPKHQMEEKDVSLSAAIAGSFVWRVTAEGHKFWRLVANRQFDEALYLLQNTKP